MRNLGGDYREEDDRDLQEMMTPQKSTQRRVTGSLSGSAGGLLLFCLLLFPYLSEATKLHKVHSGHFHHMHAFS